MPFVSPGSSIYNHDMDGLARDGMTFTCYDGGARLAALAKLRIRVGGLGATPATLRSKIDKAPGLGLFASSKRNDA